MDNLTAGNPVAHRVRVYYTGSDTIKEGEPLCYSFKTTRNWWGGSVNNEGEITASEYVAEGSHNASKYMCVESPMRVSSTAADSTEGSNVITEDGDEIDNLQVGMAVSIASASDGDFDGNYVITAINTTTNAITLDMTAAEAAAVTTQTDVTVQIDNISTPAGVVAKGGWCGKAGPRVIDIYVPNGAVVPVRTDQNCVLGRTILAINSNEQHLTAPLASYARPVAIAWETADRGTTAGLVLAKLDLNIFLYQKGDNAALLVDDKDTGDVIANRIDVEFSQATGNCMALSIKGTSSAGAASNGYGLALYAQADITDTPSTHTGGSSHWMNITGGTPACNLYALEVGVYHETAEMSSCSVYAASFRTQITDGCSKHYMFHFQADGSDTPDGLFYAYDAGAVAWASKAGTMTANGWIPINIGGAVSYIPTVSAIA